MNAEAWLGIAPAVDPDRMAQVLANLLDNALQHTLRAAGSR
jgi:signal transduction histidine kinase